jgi:hypothetical protein
VDRNSAKTEPRPPRSAAVEALAAKQRGWSWTGTTGVPASLLPGSGTVDAGSANGASHVAGTLPDSGSSSTPTTWLTTDLKLQVAPGMPSRWAPNCHPTRELSERARAKLIRGLAEQVRTGTRPSHTEAGRRWIVRFLALCCIGLVPWTIGLALTLPRTYLVDNWPFAWTGFDAMLLTCLGITAWSLWKQRQVAIPASMITSVLLLCDAWFDILTAHGGRCLMVSIATAVFAELPIAIVLGLTSVRLLHASWSPVRGIGSRSRPRSLWTAPLTAPRSSSEMQNYLMQGRQPPWGHNSTRSGAESGPTAVGT